MTMPFYFLTTSTDAADNPAGSPLSSLFTIVFYVAVFGLAFYFLILKPQKKQEKAVRDMRDSLKVGDEISTTGGIYGKVIQIKDEYIVIETGSDRLKLKIAKWAIRAIEYSAETTEE